MPSSSIGSAEFHALQDQVELLRGEVHQLHTQLSITRSEVRALQNTVSEAFEETSSVGPFTLASEIKDSEAIHYSSGPQPSQAPGLTQVQVPVPPQLDTARISAARSVGQFLKRAVLGEPRGESGRDRIRQASRYWIVVRSLF